MLKAIIVTAVVVGIYLHGSREIDRENHERRIQIEVKAALEEAEAKRNCEADPTLMGCGDPNYK